MHLLSDVFLPQKQSVTNVRIDRFKDEGHITCDSGEKINRIFRLQTSYFSMALACDLFRKVKPFPPRTCTVISVFDEV